MLCIFVFIFSNLYIVTRPWIFTQSHILIDVTKEIWSPHRNLFLPQNSTYFMQFAVVHANKTYLRYIRSFHARFKNSNPSYLWWKQRLDSDNTHIVNIKNLSYFSIIIFIKPVVLSILLFFLTLLLFVIWQQDVR